MRLFIPGQGTVDTRAYMVDAAVKQHDERLMFAQNPDTGDWCVYIKLPRPADPYPVFGFGTDIPEVSDVIARLQRADTMRNGEAIYKDMIRSQEKYRKNLEYNTDQAGEESAEVVEHFLRKEGKSPIVKSFSKGVSA